MELAQLIAKVARGKHGARDLSQEQACLAWSCLLRDDVDPVQLGAFLIAMRVKGETAAELAGFVQASRASGGMSAEPAQAIDLPCYAGKRRAAPIHLLAALSLRNEGIKICVHGLEQIEGRLSAWQFLQAAGVRRAASQAEARLFLQEDGLVYVDLQQVCPALHALMPLRKRLGVRHCGHTVARLLNPLSCHAQLNGVFHTPYVERMGQANQLLQQPLSVILMGAEGEPECYAQRQKHAIWQQGDCFEALSFADMGVAVYPRVNNIEHIKSASELQRLLRFDLSRRERAALERMQKVFRALNDACRERLQ